MCPPPLFHLDKEQRKLENNLSFVKTLSVNANKLHILSTQLQIHICSSGL